MRTYREVDVALMGVTWNIPEADLALDRQEASPMVKSGKSPKVWGQGSQACEAGHGREVFCSH